MENHDEANRQLIAKQASGTLARVLREISRDFDSRITAGIQARGHPDIRASHRNVFSNIGLGRGRVTELAERAQVTQQAMGKTLRELESLGYILRAVDDVDRRAREIQLTDRGFKLLKDLVAVSEQVNRYYAAIIGRRELNQLEVQLRKAATKCKLTYLPTCWAESNHPACADMRDD